MAFTEREVRVKDFMENVFIPTLHNKFESRNPVLYNKWNGNACRQTAIFGIKFLEKLLPQYKWQAWDGEFKDFVYGKHVTYNHAWIYGKNKDKNLLVDLSRVAQERLFIEVVENEYPKEHPSYQHMVKQNESLINIKDCFRDREYYTMELSTRLLMDLKKETDFEQFKKGLKGIE
jgi:hypothetical protein